MTEITRFSKDMDGSMEPWEDGEWVRWEDVADWEAPVAATTNTEALPEPAGIIIEFDDQGNAVVDHACEGPHEELSEMQCLYTAEQMHSHAAKVCAARDAEIERLRRAAEYVIDVDNDATNNPPESRCYTPEAFSHSLDMLASALKESKS